MDALTHAKFYATHHHVVKKGQLYGVVPYTHHLQNVEDVMRQYGVDESNGLDDLVACWCHDLVEDTDVKVRDIEENFGETVGELVHAVTSEPGENRKVRNALTYPKIRACGPRACRLKLADRISNVLQAISGGSSMAKKYAAEHADFRHALFDAKDTMNAEMWESLDGMVDRVKNEG